MSRSERLEKPIERDLRAELHARGWWTTKIHGGRFQSGLPDLYCFHPEHGERWVEVKRPTKGRLTDKQLVRFPQMDAAGVGIWILTGHDEEQIGFLFCPPNWKKWLPERRAQKPAELEELLCEMGV